MFAKFFLDPINHLPQPELDSLGVQITPADPNQATTKVTAGAATEWIGKDEVRAKIICLIIIRCLLARANLPSLNIAQVVEDILPHIVNSLLTHEKLRAQAYFRTRLTPQLTSHLLELFERQKVGSLEELVSRVERGEEQQIAHVDIGLYDLCWYVMLAGALLLEPENAYVLYVSVTCKRDSLAYFYIAGVLLARIDEKRAHYITALASSAASAIKQASNAKIGVWAVLDFLAGLGLKKWEHCKDDTHNIFPITLATLCCAAISRAARPRRSVKADGALDLLIEYCHRFVGQSCLWDWIAKMPLTNPCDRGVGDMDITPLMQAIVFSCAFERRLACDPTCLEKARVTRDSVSKRANLPHTRAQSEIDPHHQQFVGGICNTMASIYRPTFYFSQLMRVSLIFGRQATAPITESTYIGEHWNASLACLQTFDRASTLYLPKMTEVEDWSNVNKLTIPLGQCLAAVIYSLSEYTQTTREDDALRSRVLASLRQIFEKYDADNFVELFQSIIRELLDKYAVGPVHISACAFIIDSFRRTWVNCHKMSSSRWWSSIQPIIRLAEADDIKLFWTTVIQCAAIFTQAASASRDLSPAHSTSYQEAKQTLTDLAKGLRIELSAAAERGDDREKLTSTIWQIDQISEFET